MQTCQAEPCSSSDMWKSYGLNLSPDQSVALCLKTTTKKRLLTNQLTYDINDLWLHLDLSPLTWNNLMCSLEACRTSAHFPDNRQTLTCYQSSLLHCVADVCCTEMMHLAAQSTKQITLQIMPQHLTTQLWSTKTDGKMSRFDSEFTDAYKSITAITQQAKPNHFGVTFPNFTSLFIKQWNVTDRPKCLEKVWSHDLKKKQQKQTTNLLNKMIKLFFRLGSPLYTSYYEHPRYNVFQFRDCWNRNSEKDRSKKSITMESSEGLQL